MRVNAACYDLFRLQDLLDGRLADPEQAQASVHLDTCLICQRHLEQLAAGNRAWQTATQRLGRERSAVEPALWRAMEDMKGQATEAVPEPGDDELDLDFLSPTESPDALGRFGPYEIQELIGRGGMGIVLKALDPSLNRFVAIKVLAPQLAANGAARKRFAREAKAAAAVSHDHVVAIHAVESANGLPYLVMQYVPGGSLQDRLERTGPLELEEILRIGTQTASGLAVAHAQGLVHRDVKPANILLENGVERVRISDFGLARSIDDASVTQSGFLAGTPQYMAPEQARGEALDHRADLFSLGSVLYAMCAGRPPFRAASTLAVLRRVSDDTPRPIREINPRLPPWLEGIIAKLHAKNPDERFQTAGEVAELLGRHLAQVQQPQSDAPSSETDLPSLVRGPWPWRLAGVIAICLLGFVISETLGLTEVTHWAATVLRIRTPEGTLVLEVNDPDLQVSVDNDVVTINGAGLAEVRLRAGQHKVQATKDGVSVHEEIIHITRDGKRVVKVTLDRTAALPAKDGAKDRSGKTSISNQIEEAKHAAAVQLERERADAAQLEARRNLYILHLQQAQQAWLAHEADKANKLLQDCPLELRSWEWHFLQHSAPQAELRALTGHRGEITCIAVSPDGKLLATGSGDHSIRLWDEATGRIVALMQAHEAMVTALAFSPNTGLLVSGAADKSLRLWDASSGKLLLSLGEHETPVLHLAFLGTEHIAVLGTNGRLRLLEVRQGKEAALLGQQVEGVSALALSPDGRHAAIAKDGRVAVRDLRKNTIILGTQPQTGAVRSVAFSPDGNRVASAGDDKTVRVWDLDPKQAAQERITMEGHAATVRSIAFSPDGKRIASAAEDKTARVWDAETGKELLLIQAPAEGFRVVRFSADGSRIVTGGKDHVVRIWDVAPRPREQTLQGHTSDVQSLAFSPDGRFLITGDEDGVANVWNQATGKVMLTFRPVTKELTRLAFRPDARRLAAGSGDGTIELFAVDDGQSLTFQAVLRLAGHAGPVQSLAFSPDGKLLASGGKDATVRIWDAESGKERLLLKGHERSANAAAFSPDGKWLASGGGAKPGELILWDAQTGKQIRMIQGHTHEVYCLAISPDARHIVAGDDGNMLRIWDVATGKLIAVMQGHARDVVDVAYSPDGRRIASASLDGTAIIWDAATGRQLLVLRGHRGPVHGITFSPDGTILVTGGQDKTVRLWIAGPPPSTARAPRRYKAEFRDAAWSTLFEWLSDQTKLPIVAASKPSGTFNLVLPPERGQLSLPELIDLLNETLAPQKYILIRGQSSLTLVPADQKIDPALVPRVNVADLDKYGRTELVSLLLPLKSLKASDLGPEVKKLLGPFGEVSVLEVTNQLQLRDTAGNLRRIQQVIQDAEGKRP